MTRSSSLFLVAFVAVACNDTAEVLSPDTGTPEAGADVQANDVMQPRDASDATVIDAPDETTIDATADAPTCEAGLEICNGVCTDPSSYEGDGKNCGFCGHDCQGAACTNSLCAVDTIGSGLPNPVYLAVNSTTVYITASGDGSATGGSVYQCPLAGCPTKLGPMTASLNNPTAIAVDGTSVYWDNSGSIATANGSVMSCPLSDCGKNNSTRVTIVKNRQFVQGIALDSTNVYFSYWGATPYGNGAVASCPLAGCTAAPSSIITGQYKPTWVELDGSNVFMASMGGSATIPYVESGPIPGPTTGTRLYSGTVQNQITGFTLYNGDFLFTDGFKGEIDACSETACNNPHPIVTGTTSPMSLAADSKGVYWIDANGIETCPLGGCITPKLLATSANFPQNLVIDATYVYWVEQDQTGLNGQVLRVAR